MNDFQQCLSEMWRWHFLPTIWRVEDAQYRFGSIFTFVQIKNLRLSSSSVTVQGPRSKKNPEKTSNFDTNLTNFRCYSRNFHRFHWKIFHVSWFLSKILAMAWESLASNCIKCICAVVSLLSQCSVGTHFVKWSHSRRCARTIYSVVGFNFVEIRKYSKETH